VNLPERVEHSLAARKLFTRDQRLLIAVSGGVDSMVLLHLLHQLAPRHGWQLTAAHFNHQLRGRSSDADERLVCTTAKQLGLPFVHGRADVRRFARAQKLSIEMAARKLRHDFLARAARRREISAIALAHHAGDQVELFFLRLVRGSGGEGLAGMKWISPSPASAKINLVRPLLDVTKADLAAFAHETKIRFREDASNAVLDIRRNRIRRELLPLLRKHYQPALDRTILRVMEIVGAESEFVAEAARRDARPTAKTFARLSVAVQRRVLQRQLVARGIAPEFDLIERLRNKPEQVFEVNPQLRVRRDAAGVLRMNCTPRLPAPIAASAKVDLQKAGMERFGGAKISWRLFQQKVFRRPAQTGGREFFDADEIGSPILLRHRRAGDRFQPIGMATAVKLQDLFVNAKLPRKRRCELIVAATPAGEIFWVEGLRIGERFKLTARTARRLEWRWQR